MPDITIEMNFCRRCGAKLTQQDYSHVYKCQQGHVIFRNASPAVGVVLFNDKNEVVVLERAVDPGKGLLDIPGGFCDGAEPVEQAIERELEEEIGLAAADYSEPQFVLSLIDPYDYRQEVLPVLGMMFRAKLKGEVLLSAADDAASVSYQPLDQIDLDKVHFPSVRAVLERLRSEIA